MVETNTHEVVYCWLIHEARALWRGGDGRTHVRHFLRPGKRSNIFRKSGTFTDSVRNQIFFAAADGDKTKGAINFKLPSNGQVVGGTTAPSAGANADTKGMFLIEYYSASTETAAGDYKAAMYELK